MPTVSIPFILTIDWIMRQATRGKKNGKQWLLFEQLDDLDFADDIALLSHNHKQMQDKTTLLDTTAKSTDLNIHVGKTKVMKANTKNVDPIQLRGTDIEEVSQFTYLGSIIDQSGGTDKDVKMRIGKARTAFIQLRNIWKSPNISQKTKLQIFNSNVKSVLMYGSESWKTTKEMLNKIQAFVNRCLRRILKIYWPNKITNEDLWARTETRPIEEQIRKRKWDWIGHTLRKPVSNITRQALQWNPQGKRKRGRPKNTWRCNTVAEMETAGYTWKQLAEQTKNRRGWRTVVSGLCSPAEPKA